MEVLQELKSKIEQNKHEKKMKLLNAAYNLFGTIGFDKTSIQDIVHRAGVAKGTFYLYFKNKADIRNQLISTKAEELFKQAITSIDFSILKSFEDQLIYVIDYVINKFIETDELITFIDRDLSIAFYSHEISRIFNNNALGLYGLFIQGVKNEKLPLANPDITFFMIVELIGTTVFRCITKKTPCDIQTFKPYLYKAINALLHYT